MFPIVIVPPDAAEIFEQMGTKRKFWYDDQLLGRALFKEGRPGTGENWAEKLACELASLLGMPHAYYELAKWKEKDGVVSPTIVKESERLIHGNELLGRITGHDDQPLRYYQQKNHTAASVLGILRAGSRTGYILPPEGFEIDQEIRSALDVFVGYLMFDAWIANQDRHSENWGIIRKASNDFLLAPSYDHGSSLARNETDERRHTMMSTKDVGARIESYVTKARSALFPANAGKTKAFLTIDAFHFAWKQSPLAGQAWLSRLEGISDVRIQETVELIPNGYLTPTTKEFTTRLLQLNRSRLLSLDI